LTSSLSLDFDGCLDDDDDDVYDGYYDCGGGVLVVVAVEILFSSTLPRSSLLSRLQSYSIRLPIRI
jgi:hypothetical protein